MPRIKIYTNGVGYVIGAEGLEDVRRPVVFCVAADRRLVGERLEDVRGPVDRRVLVDRRPVGRGGGLLDLLHCGGGGGGGGGGGVLDRLPGGGGGGGGGGVPESYDMVLAPSDPRGALELAVVFGNFLYNDRGAPAVITVCKSLDENSPRLVFDVRYRAYKHRAYVTKKTWSGFAADHGLQGGDEISFEEHGDVFLLTAQRNGVALW